MRREYRYGNIDAQLTVGLKEEMNRGAIVESTLRATRIREAIEHGLAATHVQVIDHSAAHAGHAGAASGGGHFEVVVVSDRFEGLSRIATQRLVYQALGSMMSTDIHALTMHTFTPQGWSARSDHSSE